MRRVLHRRVGGPLLPGMPEGLGTSGDGRGTELLPRVGLASELEPVRAVRAVPSPVHAARVHVGASTPGLPPAQHEAAAAVRPEPMQARRPRADPPPCASAARGSRRFSEARRRAGETVGSGPGRRGLESWLCQLLVGDLEPLIFSSDNGDAGACGQLL